MSIRAAIDCGSNTTRLLIVDGDGRTIARDLRTTRLGHRIDATGELAPESIDKTLFALADFKNQMEAAGVTKSRAVATSAVRDAGNASELLSNAGAVLGHKLEVLNGNEEAALAYSGAISGRAPGAYVLIDIGGGSTEIAVGNEVDVESALSIDIGCVRASEQYFAGGPYVDAQLQVVNHAFEQAFLPASLTLTRPAEFSVIGVAGTITSLAALKGKVVKYEPGAVDAAVINRSDIDELFTAMTQMTTDELRSQPGLPPDRAEVIVAGTAILRALMSAFGFNELRVSESDILDGIITSL